MPRYDSGVISPVGVVSATFVIGAEVTPSNCRISFSVCGYSPSPKCAWRTCPVLSIRYSAGQY